MPVFGCFWLPIHTLDTHPKRASRIFKKHPLKSRQIWLKSCSDMLAQLALLDKPPQIWTLLNGGKLWNPSIWFNMYVLYYIHTTYYLDILIIESSEDELPRSKSASNDAFWLLATTMYHLCMVKVENFSIPKGHPLAVPWLAYSPRWYWLKATPPWTFPVKMSHGWQTMATAPIL